MRICQNYNRVRKQHTPYLHTFLCTCYCFLIAEGTDRYATLTASELDPIEGSVVTLTCNYSDENVAKISSWVLNDKALGAIYTYNNTCVSTLSTSLIEAPFSTICNSGESYTIKLLNVTTDLHNSSWQCEQLGVKSSTLVLYVKVPVKSVIIDGNKQQVLTLQENTRKKISCTTSFSRPEASVTWYLTESTSARKLTQNASSITRIRTEDLVSTRSVIDANFSKQYDGWFLVCSADNIQHYHSVFTNVTLNITYPTNKPMIQCTDGGTYKVILGNTGNLTCSVDGGNPAGILHWNCTGDITQQSGPNNNVSQTIVWTATQTQYCTCSSTNIAGTRSTSVYIDVLYPPVLSDIQNQTVFEGDSVILQCDGIRANPPAYMTRWTYNKHNVSDTTLSQPNVTRYDDTIYTCTVYNTMDPSCHHVVQGSTSKSVHLEVLYPPSVNITSGKSFTAKEGDIFKYLCPVVPGNPTSTNVSWKRSNDTKVWTSSELLIHNVSRYDDSVYTCYVTNVMVHSNGTTKLGHASVDIRLIVQYRTSVTYFHVRNYPDNMSIVVMENTSLTFECRVQGNPTTDVKIYEFENEVKHSNANKLLYDTTAACSGKPMLYSCHGYNTLNNKPSTREVQVLVKCKPRPDPYANIQYNKTSAINHTVTLSYTALGYPHPTFIWYRHGSSIDINDPRTIISSSNLQTNLTISYVEENDFGQYVVNATNDVGSSITYMYLKPQGAPEMPTNLKQINSTTTESIITLDWTPGFNNGLEQTFTLMYRKRPNGTWQSINVTDTGEQNIRYNITGLTQDTSYEVILFAFNDLGRSKSNVTLFCRTNIGPPQSMAQSVTGIVVGTISGVAVLCGIFLSAFIYRKRFVNTSKSMTSEQTPSTLPVTYENLKIDSLPNEHPGNQNETSGYQQSETNMDHTYEGLSARNNGKENEYSSLGVKKNTDHTYEGLSARNDEKDNQYSSLNIKSNTDAKVTYVNIKI